MLPKGIFVCRYCKLPLVMFSAPKSLRSPCAIITAFLLVCLVSISCTLRLYSYSPVALLAGVFGASTDNEKITIDSWPYVEVVSDEPSDLDKSTLWPYRVFKSAPSWHPPNLTVTVHDDTDLADGFLFFNPTNRSMKCVKQSAPFIMDPVANELVYGFHQPPESTTVTSGTISFRLQYLNGEPYATFWRGETVLGHGYGEIVLLDSSYRETVIQLDGALAFNKNIMPERKPPGPVDFHEHEATSRNSIIVTAYNNTQVDLSPLGGPEKGWVSDSQFYEIDIVTKEILFSWSAMDHLSLDASQIGVSSYMGQGTKDRPYDFFHINAIQPIGNNYLVNSRHMFAFYLISGEDGHIIWEFSGRGEGGDFGPVSKEGQFRWAHHARAWNVTERSMRVSLFDNHMTTEDKTETSSRGLLFDLQLPPDPNKPPTLVNIVHVQDDELFSNSQGSYQPQLNNGNQIMSYGPIPVIREFGPPWAGSPLLWQVRFGWDTGVQTYRAGKYDWHGTPADWDPSLVVEMEDDLLRGYVSWNGATDVSAWNIYAAQSEDETMTLAGRAARKGFETVFEIGEKEKGCVQIGAVEHGEEIRLSNKVCRDDMTIVPALPAPTVYN